MIAIKEWSVDRSFKAEIDKTDTRVLTNEIWFGLFPLSQQLAAAFLSLRGTSRKTKLIEIHENFIRNSEASVKPGVVPHIKQFLLVFFFPCPHACMWKTTLLPESWYFSYDGYQEIRSRLLRTLISRFHDITIDVLQIYTTTAVRIVLIHRLFSSTNFLRSSVKRSPWTLALPSDQPMA